MKYESIIYKKYKLFCLGHNTLCFLVLLIKINDLNTNYFT